MPASSSGVALAPDLRDRDERTVRAWTEEMAVTPMGGGCYRVDSESGRTYTVDVPGRRCTCADHRYRGAQCKHLRRVAIEITRKRVPPPGKRAAECAACGRESFVPETADPPLCDDCRFEEGDVVRDRETGDRLVVSRIAGDSADEYTIPDADCTVADYETNAGYPGNDPVVEVVYLGDAARRDDPREYAFPHSRLEATDDAEII